MLDFIKRMTAKITGRQKRIPCPECHGVDHFKLAGEHRFDRPQTREVIKACDLCKGKGVLTSENTAWIALGRQIKEYRTRKGMSQTDFAQRYGGLKPSELEAIEKGYRNPNGFIEFLSQRGISLDISHKAKPRVAGKAKANRA